MAVVKSNAYGHGLIECALALQSLGDGGKFFERVPALRSLGGAVDWLGVDDIDEALALRAAGITKPILVLGYTLPDRFAEAAKNNISLTVASLELLQQAIKFRASKKLKIHIKLETGLNRQGITESELPQLLDISTFHEMLKCCEVEGVYSHFAAAEMANVPKYRKYCEMQMQNFERMSARMEETIGKKLIKHMSGTAATLLLPRARYDLVRVGIGMYGLDPESRFTNHDSRFTNKISIPQKFNLKPALSWYAVIAQVKGVQKGERVGYDLTEQMKRDSKIAIVPVGYWHGYPRALNSKGVVLVRSTPCKVVGRISMDMLTIDVTGVKNVKAGDRISLIGKGLSAEEVAAKAGSINYELVTRLNPGLKRVYLPG